MYYAVKYIGRDWMPGEVLPEALDEGLIGRLLKAGAIKAEETSSGPERCARPAATGHLPLKGKAGESGDDGHISDPERAEVTSTSSGPADHLPQSGEGDDEDGWTEPDAPVIDITDGLIEATEEKAARRKKGGKAK